jgi:hypothetical protein
MAVSSMAIGKSDKTGKGSISIAGTRAILQQAICYGAHYGTNYVFVSHYNFSLMLKLHNIHAKELLVDWAIVPRTDARLALAFVLWLTCQDLKEDLKKFQAQETVVKSK